LAYNNAYLIFFFINYKAMYLLIVFLPLIGAVLAGFFGKNFGSLGAIRIVVFTMIFSFLFSYIAFYEVRSNMNKSYTTLMTFIRPEIFSPHWEFLLKGLFFILIIIGVQYLLFISDFVPLFINIKDKIIKYIIKVIIYFRKIYIIRLSKVYLYFFIKYVRKTKFFLFLKNLEKNGAPLHYFIIILIVLSTILYYLHYDIFYIQPNNEKIIGLIDKNLMYDLIEKRLDDFSYHKKKMRFSNNVFILVLVYLTYKNLLNGRNPKTYLKLFILQELVWIFIWGDFNSRILKNLYVFFFIAYVDVLIDDRETIKNIQKFFKSYIIYFLPILILINALFNFKIVFFPDISMYTFLKDYVFIILNMLSYFRNVEYKKIFWALWNAETTRIGPMISGGLILLGAEHFSSEDKLYKAAELEDVKSGRAAELTSEKSLRIIAEEERDKAREERDQALASLAKKINQQGNSSLVEPLNKSEPKNFVLPPLPTREELAAFKPLSNPTKPIVVVDIIPDDGKK